MSRATLPPSDEQSNPTPIHHMAEYALVKSLAPTCLCDASIMQQNTAPSISSYGTNTRLTTATPSFRVFCTLMDKLRMNQATSHRSFYDHIRDFALRLHHFGQMRLIG